MPAMRQYAALFLAAALMVETRVNVWAIVAGNCAVGAVDNATTYCSRREATRDLSRRKQRTMPSPPALKIPA